MRGPLAVALLILFGVQSAFSESVIPVARVEEAQSYVEKVVMRYLPTDLLTDLALEPPATYDRDVVSQQMQKSVTQKLSDDLFGSGSFWRDSFGKIADRVREATSKSFEISRGARNRLIFKVEAYKEQAGFHYTGGNLIGSFSFVGQDKNFQFLLSKPVARNTYLLLREETPVSALDLSSHLEFGYNF